MFLSLSLSHFCVVCFRVFRGFRVKLTAAVEVEENWEEEEQEERPAELWTSYADTAYPHCIECEMFFNLLLFLFDRKNDEENSKTRIFFLFQSAKKISTTKEFFGQMS